MQHRVGAELVKYLREGEPTGTPYHRKALTSPPEIQNAAHEFETRLREEIARHRQSAESLRQRAQEEDRVADGLERSLRRVLRSRGKPEESQAAAAGGSDEEPMPSSDEPDKEPEPLPDAAHLAAVALGRLGGLKGGKARAKKLSKRRRSEIAKKAAKSRWKSGRS